LRCGNFQRSGGFEGKKTKVIKMHEANGGSKKMAYSNVGGLVLGLGLGQGLEVCLVGGRGNSL